MHAPRSSACDFSPDELGITMGDSHSEKGGTRTWPGATCAASWRMVTVWPLERSASILYASCINKERPVDDAYFADFHVALGPRRSSNGASPHSPSARNVDHPCARNVATCLRGELGLGQLQQGERSSRGRLDRHDRRWFDDLVPGGGRQRRLLLRRHPHRRNLRQRSVLPDRDHLHPTQRWPMDWSGRESPERRSEPLSRPLLLEQRQPRVAAVQAHQWQLDPARRHLSIGPTGRGNPVEPHRHRFDALLVCGRCRAHHGHRHRLDRGCAGHHGLRHSNW